jgi:hypothetical protein
LPSAVADVDSVLAAARCEVKDVVGLAERYPGARGIRQLREVLALADPRAESPPESHVRVLLVQAGLPRPRPQYEVRDGQGRFVARLDLAWPELKAGLEYEGVYHRDRDQYSRDLIRHNALRALGWTILRVDAVQMRDPIALIASVRPILLSR